MRAALVLAVALALAPRASAQPAQAAPRYDAAERVRAIGAALSALTELGPEARALEAELAAAQRRSCGTAKPATAACATSVARQVCAARPQGPPQRACLGAADVLLVLARSADDWVDEATRLQLVRSAADYRRALWRELELRFAALAAELVLEERALAAAVGEELASTASPAVIDRFCARRDHRPRPPRCQEPSATCVPSVSWQRCVAALAWFVTQAPLPSLPGAAP